jgi:hypothetical protein
VTQSPHQLALGAWEAHRARGPSRSLYVVVLACSCPAPSGRGMAAEEPTDAMLRDLLYAAAIAELTARASLANRGE